jgi:hypothetical protein
MAKFTEYTRCPNCGKDDDGRCIYKCVNCGWLGCSKYSEGCWHHAKGSCCPNCGGTDWDLRGEIGVGPTGIPGSGIRY